MEQVKVIAPGYTSVRSVPRTAIKETIAKPDMEFRICANCRHVEFSGAASRCLCACHDLGLDFELPS